LDGGREEDLLRGRRL